MNHKNIFCTREPQGADKLNDQVGNRKLNIFQCDYIQQPHPDKKYADDYILPAVLKELPSTVFKIFQYTKDYISKQKPLP